MPPKKAAKRPRSKVLLLRRNIPVRRVSPRTSTPSPSSVTSSSNHSPAGTSSSAASSSSQNLLPVAQQSVGATNLIDHSEFVRRYKPPSKVLREVKFYQKCTDRLIPFVPFRKIVKEIAQELNVPGLPHPRFETKAVQAIQDVVEYYIAGLFEDAYLATQHAKRVTLNPKDIEFARILRAEVLKEKYVDECNSESLFSGLDSESSSSEGDSQSYVSGSDSE